MVTQISPTAKVYVLTSENACRVTLTQENISVSWQALGAAGQTTILVPAMATLTVPDESVLLSPMPFKAALGTGNSGVGGADMNAAGEAVIEPEMVGHEAHAAMRHATWYKVPAAAQSVVISPSAESERCLCMQLLLMPDADLNGGWLSAEQVDVRWPYGEPILVHGFSYVVTVVQIATDNRVTIIANLTPLAGI